jgi:hypothetical protein
MSYTVVKLSQQATQSVKMSFWFMKAPLRGIFPQCFFTYLACLTGSIMDFNFLGGEIQIRPGCYFLIQHALKNALGPFLPLFVLKEVSDARR